MLVKLTMEAAVHSPELVRVVSDVKSLAGGLIKVEGELLIHYTDHEALAKREWQERGFRIVSSKQVEPGKEALARLIAELEKLQ